MSPLGLQYLLMHAVNPEQQKLFLWKENKQFEQAS